MLITLINHGVALMLIESTLREIKMKYVTPLFQRGDVDRAGRNLANGNIQQHDYKGLLMDDVTIINNWRAAHSFPLNSFHVTLRARARKVDSKAITAQRIKRLSSINAKLRRFADMQLSRMHDIGGARAVVANVNAVRRLVDLYKLSAKKNPQRADLTREYDYIRHPKDDGYRGVHLVYRYRTKAKQHAPYSGLRIELQLRSQLQHTGATAVETVGTFIGQALKSSQGEDKWLRFFALMSSYIAMKERSPRVANTPTDAQQLRLELTQYVEELQVIRHLDLYAAAVDAPEKIGAQKDQHYFLLVLDTALRRITVTSFKEDELKVASTKYLDIEREILAGKEKKDAVLVSVKSFAALKRAYPNYFLDTHRFIQIVNEAVVPKETVAHGS
jgi:hypothetical protein